jgi:hypothetical protein
MRRAGWWFVGLMLCLSSTSLSANEVVVLTSFPKELFETYKKTFEAKHPGINVIINRKQTNADVTYLREMRERKQNSTEPAEVTVRPVARAQL